MKLILCTLTLLSLGISIPGCVRSVGVYEDRPRDLYYYNNARPLHRPYNPYYRRPVVVHERHHDRAGIEFHVRD